MMVYDQITFFYKKSDCCFQFFGGQKTWGEIAKLGRIRKKDRNNKNVEGWGGGGETREERAMNERATSGGTALTQRQLLIDEEFVLGGIRDIIPHLIHHSQGLTVPIYVVFHEESRGYDPESSKLCRFGGPEARTQRAAREYPEAKK